MRLAHLSDLHFGQHDEAVAATLAKELEAHTLDLVVISGDFTQRGTEEEFKVARAFLDTLSTPFLAVPGNHDVPQLNLLRRFINPYGYYRRYIAPELEPFVEIGGVAIAGLKTPHRATFGLNWQQGAFRRGQLRKLESRFAGASENAVRVVVAHHPLLNPEGPLQGTMGPVHRANLALRTFSDVGVRLVLSGHFHLSYVRLHEHPGEVKEGAPAGLRKSAAAPILVAQTSSTISTRLRGHPNAYNLIDILAGKITIAVREWRDGRWVTQEKATEPAKAAA
ncbi:MAG: metallophosphoesterase [Devosia sp.]